MNSRWSIALIVALALAACTTWDSAAPMPKTLTCLGEPDTDFALHACQGLAQAGNGAAMAFLGDYYVGRDDVATAYDWYRKAADAGNARVLRRLFDGYSRGGRVPQSRTLAAAYLQKAVDHRQEWALIHAAHAQEGRDPADAMAGYAALARTGNCFAQARLSLAYFRGDLGAQSLAHAYYWGLLALAGGPARTSDYDPDTALFDAADGKPVFPMACADLKAALPLDGIAQTLPAPALRAAQDAAATWTPGAPEPDFPLVAAAPGKPSAPAPPIALPAVPPPSPQPVADPAYAPLQPDVRRGKPAPAAIALVIGVDGYENAPRALYAEQDAKAFGAFAASALGVPADRIKLMVGRAARRLDIERALAAWAPPRLIRGESRVVVYFAGHGLAAPEGQAPYLLPYDGDADLLEASAIRPDAIIQRLKALGAAHVTLILDACYSGRARNGEALLPGTRPIVLTPKEMDLPDGVTILSAAQSSQLSHALPEAGHGLFTYEMLKGLEGPADLDGDNAVTADELFSYLRDRVAREASRLGSAQMPVLSGDGAEVLARW